MIRKLFDIKQTTCNLSNLKKTKQPIKKVRNPTIKKIRQNLKNFPNYDRNS